MERLSYPKKKINILLLENIHPNAKEVLVNEGFNVEVENRSLTEEELKQRIKGVHILGIRSKTQITKEVLDSADKLMSVCAFCIGTKQIDLDYAKSKGIVVFNAPYSNTRSVVELAIGEMIMLMRSTFARSQELHNGLWNKTTEGSNEIRGKKLGIIGYGNIGKQVSVLAESLGVDVYYYDIVEKLALGNATKCDTMEELLKKSDMVTLHVDDNPNNKNLIGEREISMMKKDSILINLSRGFVVDLESLSKYMKNNHLRGCSVDVYPEEPIKSREEFDNPLKGIENVILTPHVGGSTKEAQKNIAWFVSNKIIDYINNGSSFDSVNFPNIQLPKQGVNRRFLHIHNNVSGVMSEINNILTKHNLNVESQYLKSSGEVSYLITDVDKDYDESVIDELKHIENTIKFRVLY
jgi:D-3-phosphoglycerate dehydrogenase / 2-oxoglutarate reductase